MEEDEDVILEGTSLHEHLKNVGFTDYEVISSCYKTNALMKDMCPIKSGQNNKICSKREIYSLVMKAISVITGWSAIETSLLPSMSWRVIQAKVLEEEDLLILETMSPTMQKISAILLQGQNVCDNDSKMSFTPWDIILALFLEPNIWFIITTFAVVQYIFDICGMHWLHLIFVIVVAVSLIRLAAYYKFKCSIKEFDEFVKMIQNSNQISWKCLRFLNEVHVLKKRIDPKSTRLDLLECCYEKSLCEGFLTLLNSLVLHLQHKQCQLRHLKLENAENIYALFQRRCEVGDLQENTDEDIVAVLKNKRNGLSLLSSAFLTEFLLCFELSGSLSLFEIIASKNLSIQKEIESLEKILNLSKKVWLKEEPNLKAIISSPKSFERLKVDVVGAVDILSVKSRILAYSCVQLQELVSTCESHLDDLSLDVVKQSYEDIRNKILSCNASLEDVVERTDNLYVQQTGNLNRNISSNLNSKDNSDENVITAHTAMLSTSPASLNEIEPRVIEDEVFEAVADNEYLALEKDQTLFESLKKEKHMKKKQKERCRRVLQEIQPILQKRRKMWEERESKAITRINQKNRQNNQNSPSEISFSEDSGINSPVDSFIPDLRTEEKSPYLLSELTTCPDSKMDKLMLGSDRPRSQQDFDGEYDSEEERLLLYRRVRKELDEDEARRRNEDNDYDTDSGDEEKECEEDLLKKKALFTLPLKTSARNVKDKQNLLKSKNISDRPNSIHEKSNESFSRHTCKHDDVSGIKQSCESSGMQIPPTSSHIETDITSGIEHSSFDMDIQEPSTFHSDTSHNVCFTPAGENSYSCGDSSDENDRVLDWSSCGFGGRRLAEDGDVRAKPFSGLSTLLTLTLERTPQVGEEEVFGGVGEGESEEQVSSDEEPPK